MRVILQGHLSLIERLAVKGLKLELRLGRKPIVPEGTIRLLQDLSKNQTGLPLNEVAQLPDGRYLHLRHSRLEIVRITDGKPKVEKSFGSVGRVSQKYTTELWIHLSGKQTGLVEHKKSAGNAFKKLKMELTDTTLKEHLSQNRLLIETHIKTLQPVKR